MRPFEHDVKMASLCLRKMHSGFVLKKGVATELRLNRPNVFETECHIRMPLYGTGAERQRLHQALVQGSFLKVTAIQSKLQACYDRGMFRVSRSSPTFVHLEKAWEGEMSAKMPLKQTRQVTLTKRVSKVTSPENKPQLEQTRDELFFFKPAASVPNPAPRQSRAPVDEDMCFFTPPPTPAPTPAPAARQPRHQQHQQQLPFTLVSRTFARPTAPSATAPTATAKQLPQDEDEAASTTSSTSSEKRRSIPSAVRTVYNGVEYRSRLESNFARLLTALNIRFVYEPIKYNQQRGSTYTIDFFLPAQQLYVELKPKRPHVEEERKCEEMSRSGFRVVLMYGSSCFKPPFRSEFYMNRSHRDYAHHDALRGMAWIDGVKLAGETVFVWGNNPVHASPLDVAHVSGGQTVHLDQVVSTHDTRWNHDSIVQPMRSLLRASFT